MARHRGHGTYPARCGDAQALLHAMGPSTGPGNEHSGYQLCGGGRRKGSAPGREEAKMSLPSPPACPAHWPQDASLMVLTMPFLLAGAPAVGLHSETWPWHRQLPLVMSS